MAKADPPKKKSPEDDSFANTFNTWFGNLPVGPITQKIRDNQKPQKGIVESWPGMVKNVKHVYYHADKYVGGLLPGGAPTFIGEAVRKAMKKQNNMWKQQDQKHLDFNKDVIDRVRKQQNGS
tara:strand:+ start:126 stop:491 length:366 start_codon:yes stop_codon:yes gene_type:complete